MLSLHFSGTARSTDETSEELINTTGFPDLSLNHAGQRVNNLTYFCDAHHI